MRAVVCDQPISAADLRVSHLPEPGAPGPAEVLIDITHTALNRADLAQRAGTYPPPAGASNILGLEAAGVVRSAGELVTDFTQGDRVAALLTAGGYAETVCVPAAQCFAVPDTMPMAHAAALPETLCTVVANVFMLGDLQPEESILVHGGGGGIGATTIQLATQIGARVFATVGSDAKATTVETWGASAINYRSQDFVAEIKNAGGADLILDSIGGDYLAQNVKALRPQGRLVVIGLQAGRHGQLDLAALMMKRLSIYGTTLRSRSDREKAEICSRVRERFWPLYTDLSLAPMIDCVLPLAQVAEAHLHMEASHHTGKIVLEI